MSLVSSQRRIRCTEWVRVRRQGARPACAHHGHHLQEWNVSLTGSSPRAARPLTSREEPLRWQSKANFIYKATKQHALNLARFVSIYKTTLLAQKTLAGKERASDTFFAGVLSGWYVFGERNAINEQVRPVLLSYNPNVA